MQIDMKYGIVTINEARDAQGLPPVPWGDKLTTVLEEIGHWMKEGLSLFAKQWQAIKAAEAATANTG
jgi:hypothetical protein